jgi:hypothetical protein
MTEAEWLATEDPYPMLEFLKGKASDRRYFLVALESCRAALVAFPLPVPWAALTMCERHAAGRSCPSEMYRLQTVLMNRFPSLEVEQFDPARRSKLNAIHNVLTLVDAAIDRELDKGRDLDLTVGCVIPHEDGYGPRLIRDIFGNPFRPVPFSPAWRTDTAVSLTRAMYDARDFSAMPILADALQDAGCDNDDVLNHCRGPGPHVRGCWVVDLVLEKE